MATEGLSKRGSGSRATRADGDHREFYTPAVGHTGPASVTEEFFEFSNKSTQGAEALKKKDFKESPNRGGQKKGGATSV